MTRGKVPSKPPSAQAKKPKKSPGLARRAEQARAAVQSREASDQDLACQIREFVICGLPYKPLQTHSYQRKNGPITFEMVSSPSCGLPYGQDRLVTIWLVTAFQAMGCPPDNLIRFRSASDIVRTFLRDDQFRDPSGQEIKRLRERFERLFRTTFFFSDTSQKRHLASDSFRLIRRMSLWFDENAPQEEWQNVIELTPEFAHLIRKHSLPFDMQSIRGLKESPAALDLYFWLSWRSFRLQDQKEARIPLAGPDGLFAQLGSETTETWKARQQLKDWLREIKAFWPGCPAYLTPDGLYLVVLPPTSPAERAVQPNLAITLEGVSRNPPTPLLPLSSSFTLDLDTEPSDNK